MQRFWLPMAWWKEMAPDDRPEIQDFGEDWIRLVMGDDLGIIGQLMEVRGELWLRVTAIDVAGEDTARIWDEWLMPALERSQGQMHAYVCWDEGEWRTGLGKLPEAPAERLERLNVVNGRVTCEIKKKIKGVNRWWDRKNKLLDDLIQGDASFLNKKRVKGRRRWSRR